MLYFGCKSPNGTVESVNRVIGDIGYITKYHAHPNDCTSDEARIVSHFDFVIEELKRADVSHLSEEKQASRALLIAHLEQYRDRGQFPKNKSNTGKRLPCFIDDEGTICAVGYLVEKTAGRQLAEDINEKHQYEYISEMNDEIVDNWIANSGLTERECAMIQPTYENWYKPTYQIGISPSIVIGNRGEKNVSGMLGFSLYRGYGRKFTRRSLSLSHYLEYAGSKDLRFHSSFMNYTKWTWKIFHAGIGFDVEYFPKATTLFRVQVPVANIIGKRLFVQAKYGYAVNGESNIYPFNSPHLITLTVGGYGKMF